MSILKVAAKTEAHLANYMMAANSAFSFGELRLFNKMTAYLADVARKLYPNVTCEEGSPCEASLVCYITTKQHWKSSLACVGLAPQGKFHLHTFDQNSQRLTFDVTLFDNFPQHRWIIIGIPSRCGFCGSLVNDVCCQRGRKCAFNDKRNTFVAAYLALDGVLLRDLSRQIIVFLGKIMTHPALR